MLFKASFIRRIYLLASHGYRSEPLRERQSNHRFTTVLVLARKRRAAVQACLACLSEQTDRLVRSSLAVVLRQRSPPARTSNLSDEHLGAFAVRTDLVLGCSARKASAQELNFRPPRPLQCTVSDTYCRQRASYLRTRKRKRKRSGFMPPRKPAVLPTCRCPRRQDHGRKRVGTSQTWVCVTH